MNLSFLKDHASLQTKDMHLPETGISLYRKTLGMASCTGQPLNSTQHIINRFISSLRYRVEQPIGTLKRTYHFVRMRYKGLAKGNMELILNSMAFNRAQYKVEIERKALIKHYDYKSS